MDLDGATATTLTKLQTTVSWIELTLAFQFQTGYDIIGATTPITEQRACFKAAFAKLVRTASTTGKTGNTLKQQLRKNVSTTAAKPLTGALLQGIARRPLLDKET